MQQAADSTCLTTSVLPLAQQIVAQANCTAPGAYVTVPERPNVAFADTVFPYLQTSARDAFLAAADAAPNTSMSVGAMLQTVAQQYLLHTWSEAGTCGVTLADAPGKSPLASGASVAVVEHALWKPALEAQGFQSQGSAETAHFAYTGPGAADNDGIDVLAFQQLWNRNHTGDLLDEDGLYGPQTEGRLVQSPAEGFPLGASCASGGGGTGGVSASGGQGGSTSDSGAGGDVGQAGSAGEAGNGGAAGDPPETGCSCRAAGATNGPLPASGPLPSSGPALLALLGLLFTVTRRIR